MLAQSRFVSLPKALSLVCVLSLFATTSGLFAPEDSAPTDQAQDQKWCEQAQRASQFFVPPAGMAFKDMAIHPLHTLEASPEDKAFFQDIAILPLKEGIQTLLAHTQPSGEKTLHAEGQIALRARQQRLDLFLENASESSLSLVDITTEHLNLLAWQYVDARGNPCFSEGDHDLLKLIRAGIFEGQGFGFLEKTTPLAFVNALIGQFYFKSDRISAQEDLDSFESQKPFFLPLRRENVFFTIPFLTQSFLQNTYPFACATGIGQTYAIHGLGLSPLGHALHDILHSLEFITNKDAFGILTEIVEDGREKQTKVDAIKEALSPSPNPSSAPKTYLPKFRIEDGNLYCEGTEKDLPGKEMLAHLEARSNLMATTLLQLSALPRLKNNTLVEAWLFMLAHEFTHRAWFAPFSVGSPTGDISRTLHASLNMYAFAMIEIIQGYFSPPIDTSAITGKLMMLTEGSSLSLQERFAKEKDLQDILTSYKEGWQITSDHLLTSMSASASNIIPSASLVTHFFTKKWLRQESESFQEIIAHAFGQENQWQVAPQGMGDDPETHAQMFIQKTSEGLQEVIKSGNNILLEALETPEGRAVSTAFSEKMNQFEKDFPQSVAYQQKINSLTLLLKTLQAGTENINQSAQQGQGASHTAPDPEDGPAKAPEAS